MNSITLDISANRRMKKHVLSVQLRRGLWVVGGCLFKVSPRPCFAWRRFLLRLFGAKVGRRVNIYPSAVIYFPWNLAIEDHSSIGEHAWIYSLGRIKIGKSVTISQRAHLCAGSHDCHDPYMRLQTPPITIEDQAWVCADAYVGPNCTIKEGAVVGARAVVTKDVESWTVVGGNPARVINRRHLRG